MLKYYQILEVSRNSTLDDIKKSYKRLALKHHPDCTGGSSDKFLELQEAYQYLIKKHNSHKPDMASSMFSDIFKSMHKEPIKNQVILLNISLDEAMHDVEKTLKIKFDIPCDCSFITRYRCEKCLGVGYIKEEKRGTFLFRNIAHQNQTYIYKNYHKKINLHIKLKILSKGNFYLKKDTIHVDVPLNIFKAILGGTLKVKTPRNVVAIEIPEGSLKDFSCRLKDKGLSGKDFIVNFKLFLPKNLTLHHKKLLNSLIDEKEKEK